jgi:hypothetical protein
MAFPPQIITMLDRGVSEALKVDLIQSFRQTLAKAAIASHVSIENIMKMDDTTYGALVKLDAGEKEDKMVHDVFTVNAGMDIKSRMVLVGIVKDTNFIVITNVQTILT